MHDCTILIPRGLYTDTMAGDIVRPAQWSSLLPKVAYQVTKRHFPWNKPVPGLPLVHAF